MQDPRPDRIYGINRIDIPIERHTRGRKSIRTVISRDGTTIAYEQRGIGPALIIVLGALGDRSSASAPQLAGLLAKEFTVYTYDRRGKGDSGDTQPYAVEREIEDIEALIEAAGGEASVYGHSSGGALALLAAAHHRGRVGRLALYDVPYNEDSQGRAAWKDYISRLTGLLADGKKGDAVALFLQYTGLPAEQVAGMHRAPFWPAMEAAGHTLAYDHTAILGPEAAILADLAASVTIPTLVMTGSDSLPFMKATAGRLSTVMPNARLRILNGQAHDVSPEAVAPVLAEFLRGG